MQRGYDPATSVSLGKRITYNGQTMGMGSIGWMQMKLNQNARRRPGRGLPEWQVKMYQDGVAQLAAQKQRNFQMHMRESMNRFSSKKATQLGILQNPVIDAGVQSTVERRQSFKEFAEGIAKIIASIIPAVQKLFEAVTKDVPASEKMQEEQVEKWITKNRAEIEGIANIWVNGKGEGKSEEEAKKITKDICDIIREEEWSEGKLKKFLAAFENAGNEVAELHKILEEENSKEGKEFGNYSITIDGILLKHPVGDLHRILGVSQNIMPVTVSYQRAHAAVKAYIEDMDTSSQ